MVKKACFSYLSHPGADDCEVEPRKGTLLDMERALARGVSAGAGAEAGADIEDGAEAGAGVATDARAGADTDVSPAAVSDAWLAGGWPQFLQQRCNSEREPVSASKRG